MHHLRKPFSKSQQSFKTHTDRKRNRKREDSYGDKEGVWAETACFNTDPQPVDDTMRDSRKERKRKLRLLLIILGRIGLTAIQIGVIFGA